MSEDTNSKGPAPIQLAPEATLGTLSLQHVEGRPQILVTGGNSIPASLKVVDESGKVVALYAARAGAEGDITELVDSVFPLVR